MTPKKQTLINTLSSTISPDLVTGWKSSIGNSVRGEIVGLSAHRPATVYVTPLQDGTYLGEVNGDHLIRGSRTPDDAVTITIRTWARSVAFDHLPKFVRALPGVAEDAREKKRADIKARIAESQHRVKYLNSERDRLTVKIDQESAYIEQLEKQLETV